MDAKLTGYQINPLKAGNELYRQKRYADSVYIYSRVNIKNKIVIDATVSSIFSALKHIKNKNEYFYVEKSSIDFATDDEKEDYEKILSCLINIDFDYQDITRLTKELRSLIGSNIVDYQFVSKQLGIGVDRPNWFVCLITYCDVIGCIKPNPLFDPEFYKRENDLDSDRTWIMDYVARGDKWGVKTQQYIDNEYIKENAAAAVTLNPITTYWQQLYPKKITPCSRTKLPCSDTVIDMFFSDLDPSAFSLKIYREFNADLGGFSDEDLVNHFESHGVYENRIKSYADLLSRPNTYARFLPLDFSANEYIELNFDLRNADMASDLKSAFHYLNHGILENRAHKSIQLVTERKLVELPGDVIRELVSVGKKTCVLVHIYYPEIWIDLLRYIDNVKESGDIYVNIVESVATNELIRQIRKDVPCARIFMSDNKGRDIGGYFNLLRHIDISNYSTFVTMHTKRSKHLSADQSAEWRTNLLDAIAGSKAIFNQNVYKILNDSSIAIVASEKHRHRNPGNNKSWLNHLQDIYGIPVDKRNSEYVSGTMMIVSAEVMKIIYEGARDLEFESAEGKSVEWLMDGQLEHAIERLFGNVTSKLNQKIHWV